MKLSRLHIILLTALLLVPCVFYATTTAPDRAKARYFYLEGAKHQASDNQPEAYEYYKKAYLSDTTYSEAALAYGMMRLMIQTDSMQSEPELMKSLGMIRSFVDDYPEDFYESRTYAYLSSRLGKIDETIRIYERLDTLDPGESLTLLNLADAYMVAKQPKKALSTLDRFEKKEGISRELSLKKMGYMLSEGDTLGAVSEADRLISSNPREASFWVLKGLLYQELGNNDSTLAAYSRAEEISPDNGPVKISLAEYYKNTGDSVKYDAKLYEALLSEDFELGDKLSLLSDYLQTLLDGRSDTSRGDHLFSVIQSQYPHEPEVLDLAARYSAAKGDYADAIGQIGYALDLDPTKLSYWAQLMRYQLMAEKGKDAMATYEKAKEHVEMTDAVKILYASAAAEEKEYEIAEKVYADLIHEINPDLPLTDSITDSRFRNSLTYDGLAAISSYYNLLGDMYYSSGDLDKTYKAYDNSLYFYPENPLALNNYAYFLAENGGDLERAEEMSLKCIEQVPDNETYLDTYAWILFKRKDYKEALEYMQKAIDAATENNGDPDHAEFFSHYGDILFMNHQPDEAVENWKKALKLDPENSLLKKKIEHKTFFYE